MHATNELAAPQFFALIGDPLRWELLRCLSQSDQRVGDLVELTGRAQNAVSYHLGALRDAGLVSGRRSAADGRDSYYRLHADRFRELVESASVALDPTVQIATRPARTGRRGQHQVLFLCTGNSARSQIAEALTNHRSAGVVKARSAGSHPKALHPNAVRVLAERGIDISRARTKHLDTMRHRSFDQVVTLCDKVKEVCPEFPGSPRNAHWSMADPATSADTHDETYPAFVATADDIDDRVGRLLAALTTPDKGASHADR
jgi:protein-tyrosine-phosphatase